MNKYIVSFPGHWLIGYMYIEAENKSEAVFRAYDLIKSSQPDLVGKNTSGFEADEITGNTIIWDGDY